MGKASDLVQSITLATLSVLIVLGAFATIGFQLYRGQQVQVPDIEAVLVGGVVTAYFTHQAAVNGGRQAGTAVVQAAAALLAGNGGGAAAPAAPAAAPAAPGGTGGPQTPAASGG